MGFLKTIKSRAYFKRYQVKFARRRSGKTDYRARKRLVSQDKNKYSTPRYRLVVRATSHYIICQVMYTEIKGDHVVASAYSSELPRYGVTVGLKNYAAAYCTGLLVARRVLTKFGLADAYKGNEEVTGETVTSTTTNEFGKERQFWVAEVADDRKPFRCVLDIGVRNATTGAKIFGALKGAVDGGLDIPHNEKRFPGYNRDAKEYDADEHKDRIFGEHIADYMRELAEENPEYYSQRFSKFEEAGVDADDLEDMYTAAHEKIREDPSPAPKKAYKSPAQFKKPGKSTNEERAARLAQKKLAHLQKLRAQAAEEDDE